ncbi:class I SAM-dependent methyltransferase [Pontibacillus yanchengensis]|uniref:SAM-dependent methlyltransferase n=1 Tax=Pontibacillus yanchengensis Y32 TaxID=1385514 RepID=A0A0A2TPK6_9BACI|nr:class I SAM-dependent methyltransferase [Pontibacillus yanchengensis]KGP71255.1 SAM-dependent methlyltransferase [Pontibacillus yanchengensis Y32]
MGEEKGADYYDKHINRFLAPLETSPWKDLYVEVLSYLSSSEDMGTIIDLGCGTGRLARLLVNHGYTDYFGIDFSKNAIQEATAYVPEATFVMGDLYDRYILEIIQTYRTFIILEVLEHLERDREVIASLPKGSRVIISVPNFDNESHVRTFSNIEAIEERYESLLTIEDHVTLVRNKEKDRFIYVCLCTKQ